MSMAGLDLKMQSFLFSKSLRGFLIEEEDKCLW